MNSVSILFSIGVGDPASSRARRDAHPSGKPGSAAGARRSETHAGQAILRRVGMARNSLKLL